MNKRLCRAAGLIALLAIAELVGTGAAFARGGAANIMNSPGYQRRLQESRGYVTNQSGSALSVLAPHVKHSRRWKRRH